MILKVNLLDSFFKEVLENSNPEKANFLQRFFKTGIGEYAEGDIFAGITVPISRQIARKFYNLNFNDLKKIVKSKIHEERLIALLILVDKFKKEKTKEVFNFYLQNRKYVNNWDLVDLSADKIVGAYLIDKEKNVLYDLAKSEKLWDRRISIISTFYFIRHNSFKDTLKISDLLLNDKEDLIQKAVGWMLREVGKRDLALLEKYLKTRYKKMPRTMLRYSIEKFEETKRQKYLKNKI